tara:strand:+ start:486 stop:905 length:420 start_codon:yes stop_codon:yes gene_type:complete
MLPIIELRGAIPWAYFIGGLTLPEAVFYSIIGNFLMCPVIFYFFKYFTDQIKKTYRGNIFINWLFNRTRKKGEVISKRKFYGLVLFVGIPLPVTGAWTGMLAAYIFGLPFGRSLLSVLLGLLISSIIVCSLIGMGLLIF